MCSFLKVQGTERKRLRYLTKRSTSKAFVIAYTANSNTKKHKHNSYGNNKKRIKETTRSHKTGLFL
jgi:hypothetical protein